MSNEQELQHHGILGMKWGVRRYQNKDGSLTPAGKSHKKIKAMEARADAKAKKIKEEGKIKVAEAKAKAKAQAKIDKEQEKIDSELKKIKAMNAPKEKSISEMSESEIRARINRIDLENELRSKMPVQKTAGQKFVDTVRDKVLVPGAIEGSKQAVQVIVKDAIAGAVSKFTGTDKKTAKAAVDEVGKAIDNAASAGKGDKSGDNSGGKGDKSGGKANSGKSRTHTKQQSKPKHKSSRSMAEDFDEVIDLKDYIVHDTPASSPSLNNAKRLGQSYIAGLLGVGSRDRDDD